VSDATTIGADTEFPPRRRRPKVALDLAAAAAQFKDKIAKGTTQPEVESATVQDAEEQKPGLTEEQLGEPVKLGRYDPFVTNLFGGR
jgi:hypothetical protein